ncbi:MAG: ATP-binding protein [Armatimonadetes bacterium]|nr:ATP-binding protein [Armatimonadota bacterium]
MDPGTGPKIEIKVPLNPAECSRVRRVVACLASAALDDPIAIGDVELAVGEAFSNAVKYGQQGSATVYIDLTTPKVMKLEMVYQGAGFDTTVKYPRDVEKASGGFGRFIMDRVLDMMDYTFEEGRTILRMSKTRP